MPLENATNIAQLDATWPLGLDSASRGDDHLRLLKAVLKAQFPGAAGNGFSKPITITEDQLNGLPEKVDGLANKWFPVGTVVLRMDSANPGNIYGGTWTLITGDACLSFGNGSVQSGSPDGTNDPWVPVQMHNHGTSHNLYTGEAGGHNHAFKSPAWEWKRVVSNGEYEIGVNTRTAYTEWAGQHGHPIYGGVAVNNAGTANATLNVRGARIAINVWRRTS